MSGSSVSLQGSSSCNAWWCWYEDVVHMMRCM